MSPQPSLTKIELLRSQIRALERDMRRETERHTNAMLAFQEHLRDVKHRLSELTDTNRPMQDATGFDL